MVGVGVKEKAKKRGLVLFCICCNTFCFGGLYAWSIFSGELAEYKGWDYSHVTLAYSIQLIVLAVMGLIGGVLFQKIGAKKLIMIAGIMWGLGWIFTGFANSVIMLCLTFGVLTGCASSFGYNPGTITAVSWFPDKKGFAAGMTVGMCGVAPLIVAPLASYLLTRFNVMTAFRLIGGIFLVMSIATTWYIDTPPAGWRPAEYKLTNNEAASSGKTWREMLKDPRSYMLWIILLCASVGDLTLVGHVSKIGQELIGITSAQAAMLIGIMAAANFLGRIILGSLSDVLGRYTIVCGTMIISAIDMIIISHVTSYMGFVIAVALVGVCFSGTLATFSALTSDIFGSKYNGINYSIIFTGYGIAGVIGPNVAVTIQSVTGSYLGTFIFVAGCNIVAAVLCVLVKFMNKKGVGLKKAF